MHNLVNNTNTVKTESDNILYNISPEEGLINKTLPPEVFQSVLSYLDDKSIQV